MKKYVLAIFTEGKYIHLTERMTLVQAIANMDHLLSFPFITKSLVIYDTIRETAHTGSLQDVREANRQMTMAL